MSARKSLLVLTFEPPYPPNHGMRIDQWNRYSLLKSLGWDLGIITWMRASRHGDPPRLLAELGSVFSTVILLENEMTIQNLLWRLVSLPVYSQHVSNLFVPRETRTRIIEQLRPLRPGAVLVDHLYPSLLGKSLARDLSVPLLYRANNVEHVYVPQMAAASPTFVGKLKYWLAALHLRQFEYEMHRDARWTFDCSKDDLAFWRTKGFSQNSWAPPLVNEDLQTKAPPIPWNRRSYDAVFLGALISPANIEAVRWFVECVMPHVVAKRPDVRILIAGAKPPPALRQLVGAYPQLSLLADPPSATAVRAQGRVLINPILRGSGINVKVVEMLFADSPIVTTSVGTRGFDEDSKKALLVADDPKEFALKLLGALEGGTVDEARRVQVRDRFGRCGAELFSRELESVVA